jgi:photosystem II stability/assembly factor-like uncharacterized protein
MRSSGTDITPLFASTWTGTEIITVGAAGVILSSSDAVTWSEESFSVTNWRLNDVVWNGSRYIAVGDHGVIVSSTDGIEWVAEDSGISSRLNSVVWAGSSFYAVGDHGVVISSTDGSSWTVHDLGLESLYHLNDIVWSGTQFVAVGDEGRIIQSLDGLQWTSVVFTNAFNDRFESVAWSGTEFIAVGESNYSGALLSSPDGINWTTESTATTNGLVFYRFKDISFNGEQYIVMSEVTNNYYISTDGTNWTAHSHDISRGLWRSMWTGTSYIAVGNGVIGSSEDGVSWVEVSAKTDYPLLGIASSGNQVVVVGDVGNIFSINY